MPRRTKVHTRDGYDLSDLLMEGIRTFEKYNEEAERPWLDLFTKQVSDGSIQQEADDRFAWDRLGEMEHMGTNTLGEGQEVYFTTNEYGTALSWNRGYVNKNGRDELAREFTALVEGYDKQERDKVQDALLNGAADGSELWFDPGERGDYAFDATHNHTFGSTDDLFANDPYGTDSSTGNAHTPTEHIRRANAHLRHHDKSPSIVLCSSLFKEQFIDEVSWEASYQFPEYEGLRTLSIKNADARVDGVTLVETPYINDHNTPDGEYTFHVVADDDPIAFWQNTEPQLVRNEQGAPITGPYQLFDAYGYADYGLMVEDPLSMVAVTADNLA